MRGTNILLKHVSVSMYTLGYNNKAVIRTLRMKHCGYKKVRNNVIRSGIAPKSFGGS